MPSDLREFLKTTALNDHLRVETDLGDGFVRLKTEEAERRQAAHDIRCIEDAVIELLRNSRDASSHTIYFATYKEGDTRISTIIDDGVGVPPALHYTIFEPRVTSKLDSVHLDKWGVHGRGMALYSIKVNTQNACVVYSDKGLGASLRIISDSTKLKEKADQSTFPQFTLTDEGRIKLSGPHNMLRTCVEFSLEERNNVVVYYGSPVEIAATLYRNASAKVPLKLRSQGLEYNAVRIVDWLAYASEPQELTLFCSVLGLNISERTAYRILNGDVSPVASLQHRVYSSLQTPEQTSISPAKVRHCSARAVKLTSHDEEALSLELTCAIEKALLPYYLQPCGSPRLSVRENSLTLAVDLSEFNAPSISLFP